MTTFELFRPRSRPRSVVLENWHSEEQQMFLLAPDSCIVWIFATKLKEDPVAVGELAVSRLEGKENGEFDAAKF